MSEQPSDSFSTSQRTSNFTYPLPSASVKAASSAGGKAAPTAASGAIVSARAGGVDGAVGGTKGVSVGGEGRRVVALRAGAATSPALRRLVGRRRRTRRGARRPARSSGRLACAGARTRSSRSPARAAWSAGSDGSSTPRHCRMTTGYSCSMPSSPKGLRGATARGCAPRPADVDPLAAAQLGGPVGGDGDVAARRSRGLAVERRSTGSGAWSACTPASLPSERGGGARRRRRRPGRPSRRQPRASEQGGPPHRRGSASAVRACAAEKMPGTQDQGEQLEHGEPAEGSAVGRPVGGELGRAWRRSGRSSAPVRPPATGRRAGGHRLAGDRVDLGRRAGVAVLPPPPPPPPRVAPPRRRPCRLLAARRSPASAGWLVVGRGLAGAGDGTARALALLVAGRRLRRDLGELVLLEVARHEGRVVARVDVAVLEVDRRVGGLQLGELRRSRPAPG